MVQKNTQTQKQKQTKNKLCNTINAKERKRQGEYMKEDDEIMSNTKEQTNFLKTIYHFIC